MAIRITGTIKRIDLKNRAPYKTPKMNGNIIGVREFYASVIMSTDGGDVCFDTPAITRTVSELPLTITFSKNDNGFMREVINAAAFPNKHLALAKKIGDTITIDANLHAVRINQFGNPYRVLNRVHLVN